MMKVFQKNSNCVRSEGSVNQHMKKGNLLLAAVGIALLVWVVVHAGPSVIVHQLKVLRIALPIVVALIGLAQQVLAGTAGDVATAVVDTVSAVAGVR
jgi:hypothetical protein